MSVQVLGARTSTGEGIAAGIHLTDVLPAGFQFLGLDEGVEDWTCTESAGVVDCADAPLLKRSRSTGISLRLQAPATTGSFLNHVAVTSQNYDPDEKKGNNVSAQRVRVK